MSSPFRKRFYTFAKIKPLSVAGQGLYMCDALPN